MTQHLVTKQLFGRIAITCAMLAVFPARAQEAPAQVPPQPSRFEAKTAPRTERFINMTTARTTRPLSLLLVIDHRAVSTFMSKNAGYEYLGLDAGLKVGIGLRFGILEDLDVGLYRLNNKVEVFDTYDLDVRWRFLKQDRHFIDMAVRAGATLFIQPNASFASGYSGQLLINRSLFDQLLLGVGFGFHSNSSNAWKRAADDEYSGAILAAVEWRFLPNLAWDLEMGANVMGYGSTYPALATSLKVLTFRHTFALVFANNFYMATDGYITNTEQKFDEWVIGFQITREFNFK